MIPRPGGGGRLPVKTTTTIKKTTPSGTSISTTTIERTGPTPRTAPSGLRPPKTLYAAPVREEEKEGCGSQCTGGTPAAAAGGGLRYGGAQAGAPRSSRISTGTGGSRISSGLRYDGGGGGGRPSAASAGGSRISTGSSRISTGAIPKAGSRIGTSAAAGGSLKFGAESNSTTINVGGKVSTTAMKSTVQPPPPSRAGPPKKSTTTLSSTSTSVGTKKITKSTKKTTAEGPTSSQQGLAPGYYYVPFQTQPRSKEGRFMPLSSPHYLRPQMERKKMPNTMILPQPSQSQCYRTMLRTPGFKDIEAGALFMGGQGQPQPDYRHETGPNVHDQNLNPEDLDEPEDWESPKRNQQAEDLCHLEQDVEEKLMVTAAKSPGKPLKGVGSRQVMTTSPVIMTDHGPIEATKEIITSKSVVRSPGQPEIIGQHMVGIETVSPGKAIKRELEIQRLSPKYKSPETIHGREVVHVTSSVLVSPGIIQKTKTVTYDRPNEPPTPKKHVPTPVEVAQMIEEELEDIDKTKGLLVPDLMVSRPTTYGTRKNVEITQLTRESVSVLEQSVIIPSPNPDEEQEEPQPEMIANMMNTEERGLAMGSPPTTIYNFLFSDEKTEAIVEVCSAAPIPLQDVVVPAVLPDQAEEFNKGSDVIQAAIEVANSVEVPVKDNLYVESVGNTTIQSKNTARKGKRTRRVPVLSKEIPPWGIQDVEQVQDVVGAPLSATLQDVSDTECNKSHPETDGIEYILHMEPPKHSSRVQLRGCQKPNWFPGYMIALPDIPDTVGLAKSPSIVFNAAWRATQPDIFSENSFFIV